MSQSPETPIVTTRQADEVSALWLPEAKENFATDAAARQWVEDNLLPAITQAESDGENIRAEWREIQKMVFLEHSDVGYVGESNAYVPAYAKASASKVSALSRALFPSDQFLDVTAEKDEDTAYEEELKAWMHYQFENNAKLRLGMKPFLRQLVDYGFSIGKVWWNKPVIPDKAASLNKTLTGLYGGMGAAACEGLRFQTRSIFSWYCWPTTVDSLDAASLIFEVMQVSKQFADNMFKAGRWVNRDEVGEGDTADDAEVNLQEQQNLVQKNTSTAVSSGVKGELGSWFYAKECWLRMPVPARLYGPDEVKGSPVPCKVLLVGGVPVEITRNPFWHQKPPYVMHRLEERPDMLHGIGIGRMALELQRLLNDTTNQNQDNLTYALNPLAIIQSGAIVGNQNVKIAPGAVFNVTDVSAVKFDRPPIEQVQYGNVREQQLISAINDFGGAPAMMQGTSSKGVSKTATGSQILQNNVKGESQDVVEDIELAVLVPAMQMAASLGQQYETDERFLAITGGRPVRFRREAFLGQYKYRWMASSQTANQQMRAQQALMFLQQLTPLMPVLAQQGKTIDPIPVMRRFYADAIGGRDFDKVVVSIQEMQQRLMQSGAMMPGMPGAPGAPPPGPPPSAPGGEPRSAVEQAPGGPEGSSMAPGEAEDFMGVRAEADDMAAMMGAAGGMPEEY